MKKKKNLFEHSVTVITTTTIIIITLNKYLFKKGWGGAEREGKAEKGSFMLREGILCNFMIVGDGEWYMNDVRTPLVPLFRLLLVCALVALRAPLAQPPNLRPHSSPPIPNYNIIRFASVVDTTEAKPDLQLSAISSSDVAPMSKARVYADVNVLRPKDYWDYESLTVQWGFVSIPSS